MKIILAVVLTLVVAVVIYAYDFIKSALPQKIARSLSIVDVNRPLSASASIAGPLKGGDPEIYVNWVASDIGLKTLFFDFDHTSFNGFYSNEVTPGLPRKDPNSLIEINGFTAQWHGLPVQSGKIRILDLYRPKLTCDFTSRFSLVALNELIGSKTLHLNQGEGNIQLNYAGPLARNDSTNSFLDGTVSFKDASIQYMPRKWAKKCLEWQGRKKKVYVYFDNDQEGYAAFNAITLKAIIDNLANKKE